MDQNTPTKLVPPFTISSYVSIHPFNWKKTWTTYLLTKPAFSLFYGREQIENYTTQTLMDLISR